MSSAAKLPAKKKVSAKGASSPPAKPLVSKTGKPTNYAKSAENKAKYAAEQKSEYYKAKTIKTSVKVPRDKVPNHPLMLGKQSWDREKVMDYVCLRLSSTSLSIVTILYEGYEGLPLPTYTAIRKWCGEDEALDSKYARAKSDQADYLGEEMLSIADTPELGETVTKSPRGIEVKMSDMTEHRKIRIETRKWLMGKLKPKKYGDKLGLVGGDGSGPVQTQNVPADLSRLSEADLAAALTLAEKVHGR